MSRLYTAFRPLLAALPALSVLLWLLAPALSEARSGRPGCEREAQVSQGSPPAPTPARLLESEVAELLDPGGEDTEDDCEADERAVGAEISTLRVAVQRCTPPHESRPQHRGPHACCIRGPPRALRS
ncbi:hypothetical protein [Nannocystis sp.]|uniref:hypothetical protein n=1 Tax=Nannocystis sp. TaxID=1962667 RepID=UPI002427B863|nr:hypothetical protein [Nannocystis sp.]MBK7826504.1 hypothetical protein [Nannocystis sp.]MBK9752203.1 hypothetical protein [Nannocystis sp.]